MSNNGNGKNGGEESKIKDGVMVSKDHLEKTGDMSSQDITKGQEQFLSRPILDPLQLLLDVWRLENIKILRRR